MLKEQFERLNPQQQKMVAIAYLVDNPAEQPESCMSLISKLKSYDSSGKEINEAIKQAQKSISELKTKMDQVIGSINAITDIIGDQLPAGKIPEWALKFNLEQNMPAVDAATKIKDVDIAGSTARK